VLIGEIRGGFLISTISAVNLSKLIKHILKSKKEQILL